MCEQTQFLLQNKYDQINSLITNENTINLSIAPTLFKCLKLKYVHKMFVKNMILQNQAERKGHYTFVSVNAGK